MSIQDRMEQLEQESRAVELSYHSIQRARERMGLNASSAERIISRAYVQGLGSEDFTASEKDYLKRKGVSGAQIKVYNGFCCVFSDSAVCITVFKLPGWFGRRQHFDGKTKIRDPRSYYRHYGVIV